MESNNLISIIIPVYNSSKYIKDTIESIEMQTYENYEAIFIDDNSEDNSVDIIEEFKKKNDKIKLIKLKKHKGVSKARNIGIKIAKGRYLTFLDSDDIWLDKKLEKQLKFIQENNYEFVYCSYRYMSDDGTKIGKKIRIKQKVNYKEALLNIRILTITTMIDLNKIPKKYCYMPESKIEDIITWWNILKKGYIAYGQDEVLAYYRKTKNSKSSNKYKEVYYRWNAYRKIEKLGLIKTMYYYFNYIINAISKRITLMKLKDKYKEIEVGLSTMNLDNDNEVDKLIKKMKITSKYIIINQNEKENISITNKKVITKKEKGISKSRNEIIKSSESEIVLLSDDDVVFEKDYEQTIVNAWNKYQDSDIICFFVESQNKKRKIKRIKTGKVNYINAMKIVSVEITFKREKIIENNLYFNENFGAGTELNRGEDIIFLYEALKKGLKIRFINKKIGEVEQKTSSWFKEYNEEYFKIQGKVFKKMAPKYYKILCLQYAIRKYYKYHKNISFIDSIKNMLEK